MAQKNGIRKTKFVMPKYKKWQEVKTPDGIGKIYGISHVGANGYFYEVNGQYYAEIELKAP